MVAYCTGSDPIEIGDLESNVKITVTENVCKNDEKILRGCKHARNIVFTLKNETFDIFITPPRNRGGVILSLQFVCVCVCLSVCLCVRYFLVNKIPAERMNRCGRGFR